MTDVLVETSNQDDVTINLSAAIMADPEIKSLVNRAVDVATRKGYSFTLLTYGVSTNK